MPCFLISATSAFIRRAFAVSAAFAVCPVTETPKLNSAWSGTEVMIPTPFTVTVRPAVAEAEATARYVLDLAERNGVPVDFNLHPYYPSRIGLERFPGHPRADLELAGQLARLQQPDDPPGEPPAIGGEGRADAQHARKKIATLA